MPTSLIYIILSTRGFTPWRPDAVMSTPRTNAILPQVAEYNHIYNVLRIVEHVSDISNKNMKYFTKIIYISPSKLISYKYHRHRKASIIL